MFITIEGIDGAGKTTQAKILHSFILEYVKDNAMFSDEVTLTNEPNDGRFYSNFQQNPTNFKDMTLGQIVRSLISERDSIESINRLLLIYAARYEHVKNVIDPSIANNQIVICDRFYDSSIAYFGHEENIGFEKAKEIVDFLHKITLGNFRPEAIMPTLTFYIDLKPSISSSRMEQRQLFDKLDKMSNPLFTKIRDIFKRLVKEDPNRCIVINGNNSIENVSKEIREKFIEFMERNKDKINNRKIKD